MIDVAANLAEVRRRIADACTRAGRATQDVRLVAVSKRIDLDLVVEACRAGQWDLGENRVVEALERQTELAGRLRDGGLDADRVVWHFIGHLQRNKAGKAAGRFALLHGLDSLDLAEKLATRAESDGRREPVLVEVNLTGEDRKNGVPEDRAVDFVARLAERPGLEARGLMGMARYGADERELHATFAGLRGLVEQARQATGLPLPELSMGMSGDFEIAVEEGATLVRVGTAIFGVRRT